MYNTYLLNSFTISFISLDIPALTSAYVTIAITLEPSPPHINATPQLIY
jgi:hypothetical protein